MSNFHLKQLLKGSLGIVVLLYPSLSPFFFSLYFSGIVDRLKVIAKEREGIPLNDDVQEVFHLSEVVESILRHQQKGEHTHNVLCMQNRPATLGQLVSREKLMF